MYIHQFLYIVPLEHKNINRKMNNYTYFSSITVILSEETFELPVTISFIVISLSSDKVPLGSITSIFESFIVPGN